MLASYQKPIKESWLTFLLLFFRMARNFEGDDVLEMIELSDWGNSSGEESAGDVDKDGKRLDPLDIEQMNINYSLTTMQLSTCVQLQPLPSVLSSHPPLYSSAHSLSPSPPSPPPQSQYPFNPPAYTGHPGPTTIFSSFSSPADFFLLLFDDIIQLSTDETNPYAAQNPAGDLYKQCDTSVDEIELFLGMIIAMGLHQLPAYSDYWSSDILLGVPGIVSGMPLDGFKILLKCLHLNDNTTCIPRGIQDMIDYIRYVLHSSHRHFFP